MLNLFRFPNTSDCQMKYVFKLLFSCSRSASWRFQRDVSFTRQSTVHLADTKSHRIVITRL